MPHAVPVRHRERYERRSVVAHDRRDAVGAQRDALSQTTVLEPPELLRRRFRHAGRDALVHGQVADAAWIAAIAASSAASNSASLIPALSPSTSAREKEAMTLGLRASRAFASSRA